MATFMEKFSAVELSGRAGAWLAGHRAAQDKDISDFHIQPPEPTGEVMPIAGVNGVTKAQADAYWDRKHNELESWAKGTFGEGSRAADWIANHRKNVSTNEYNRNAMEREIAQSVDRAKADAKRHSGIVAGLHGGYTSSQGLVPGVIGTIAHARKGDIRGLGTLNPLNYVTGGGLAALGDIRDLYLMRNYVDKDWVRRQNARLAATNPVDRARQQAYMQTLAQQINPKASALRRQEHAAGHLEGSFHNGLYGWAVNPVLKRLPGKMKANDVMQLATGLDTNRQATAYRAAYADDFGAEAARRAEQWLRGFGVASYVAGAAIPAIATAGTASSAQAGTQGTAVATGNMARLGNIGKTFIQGYMKWQPRAEGLRQLGRFVDEGGLATDPRRQVAGSLLNSAGDMAANMPLFDATSAVVGMGVQGIAGSKAFSGAAGSASRALGKLPYMSNGGIPDKVVKGAVKVLGRDLVSGVTMGVASDIEALADGRRPEGSVLDRYTNGWITGYTVKPALKGFMNKFDSTATMVHAGEGRAEQMKSIDEMMKDPEALQQFKDMLGDPGMTDEDAYNTMPTMLAAQRYENSYASALASLDKKFDWDNCTPEEYKAKWDSYTPEQRGEALFKAFRNDAVTGGFLAPEMFTNPDLSQDQKKQLLAEYLQSEDNATGGTLVGQMFRGEKNVALSAMRNSKGARQACVAYASGLVQQAMDDPSSMSIDSMDDTAKAVLDELSPAELKQVMAPIADADPEKLMSMQQALGASSDSRLADAGTAVIMERMANDGNFAARFIPSFTEALQNGNGISDADSAKMIASVSDQDIKSMFDTMDDDNFQAFARWALSGKGNDALKDMPGGQGEELMDRFTNAAKARAWQAVKRNPLKNMPAMAGLWMQSRGWNGLGNLASNPMVFYGTMALLTLGAVWLGKGLFNEDNDDDGYIGDSADAVAQSNRQRELLMKDLFG